MLNLQEVRTFSTVLTHAEVFADLEASKYQMAEYRISIYGRYKGLSCFANFRSMDEWDKLASWIVDNKLFSHNVRWLVQIPRLYNVYHTTNIVKTFNDLIKSTPLPTSQVVLTYKICFNRYLKSHRIQSLIPSYISSSNASLASTLSTTRVKSNDDCTADSRVQNNGIQTRIRHIVITSTTSLPT